MGESTPEFKRVQLDVRSEVLPELLEELGNFATRHNVILSVSDTPISISPKGVFHREVLEESYGPVKWVESHQTGELVGVITREHLKEFWVRQHGGPGAKQTASRAFGVVGQHASFYEDEFYEKLIYRSGEIEGFRLDTFLELISSEPHTRIPHFGKRQTEILKAYARMLAERGLIKFSEE